MLNKPFFDVVDHLLIKVNKVHEIQLNSQAMSPQIMVVCLLKDGPDVTKQWDHLCYTSANLCSGHRTPVDDTLYSYFDFLFFPATGSLPKLSCALKFRNNLLKHCCSVSWSPSGLFPDWEEVNGPGEELRAEEEVWHDGLGTIGGLKKYEPWFIS